MTTEVFRSFAKGTTTKSSMARLRNILNGNDIEMPDETGVLPSEEKYARYDNQFNPAALTKTKDDESYEGEEPGMSNDVTVCEADNVIANTGINPIMFEEGIDTEARMNVLRLHSLANGLKVPEVSQSELDKREEIEAEQPENKHYRLMEVKHTRDTDGGETENIRRFYWNGTEGYETTELNMDCPWYSEDQEDFKNQEKMEHERKQKVAIQLLYKKLKESKAGMKQAYNQKHYQLAQEFRREYEYCSGMLDKLKECDEKIKALQIKKRKDILYTNRIRYSNLGGKLTIEDVKKMINEKSLAYAEKVIENKLSALLLKEKVKTTNS